MGTISLDVTTDKTCDIDECGNNGCMFNTDKKCTSNDGECFGYIDTDWPEIDMKTHEHNWELSFDGSTQICDCGAWK